MTERNFCPRCGKRMGTNEWDIHTCTPPDQFPKLMSDDIVEMARQAGFPFSKYGLLQGDDEGEIDADAMFKVFAELVAAKEREACEKRAEIALLGTLKTTSERVLKAIRNRGKA